MPSDLPLPRALSLEMKALLLPVLLLGLVAALQAQDDPLSLLSEKENITGTWYTKALVANKTPPGGKRSRKAFPSMITALEDGILEARTTFMIQGQCHEKKMLMHETETPGKYTSLDGKKAFYLAELPVKDHYIAYCEDQGKGFRMGKLMGRTPEQNPEALEEFRKFTKRRGFPEENIFLPQQAERCIPEHD